MVADLETGLTNDVHREDPFGRSRVAQEVIDAPPLVVSTSVASVGPPGVDLLAFAFHVTEAVDPPVGEQFAEPRPLLRKETARLRVPFGVPDVVFGVGDVEVSNHDHGVVCFEPRRQPCPPCVHPALLVRLALRPASAVGQVGVDTDQFTVAGHEDASFDVGVVFAPGESGKHILFEGAERGDAGVALLFRGMKVNRMAFRPRPILRQLLFQNARFLQHQHVRTNGLDPSIDALPNGGAEAIDVPRHEAHATPACVAGLRHRHRTTRCEHVRVRLR